jgi:hypothetical protein
MSYLEESYMRSEPLLEGWFSSTTPAATTDAQAKLDDTMRKLGVDPGKYTPAAPPAPATVDAAAQARAEAERKSLITAAVIGGLGFMGLILILKS